MTAMRWLFVVVAMVGCGGMPQATPDLGPGADLAPGIELGAAPAGFGAPCTSSPECAGYKIDRAPGFLGCGNYLGANYCTMPCGQSAGGATCWAGATCACVERTNAGGFSETDCYCSK